MKQYDKEFKLMIVDLLESGQPARQVSENYKLNANMIRRWHREQQSNKLKIPQGGGKLHRQRKSIIKRS